MSRVHDALRRAEQAGMLKPPSQPEPGPSSAPPPAASAVQEAATATLPPPPAQPNASEMEGLLARVQEIPFRTATDSLLIDASRPHEAPMEEFRTLRTRLNHMKTLQPIHTVVVTSPSPAEGKSLSAANLALAQSYLSGNTTLLADFDFRRPVVHTLFGIDRGPGITDYLLGKCQLHEAMRRVAGTDLYILPAGEAVINPLELLNLREVRILLERLPSLFQWVIMDSPPLLFAADANLLSTMSHGTLLVVRIGHTTIDSVTRAMQSLCDNNVLGIVVNGARRGELYSKYTYYHSYYTPREEHEDADLEGEYEDGEEGYMAVDEIDGEDGVEEVAEVAEVAKSAAPSKSEAKSAPAAPRVTESPVPPAKPKSDVPEGYIDDEDDYI